MALRPAAKIFDRPATDQRAAPSTRIVAIDVRGAFKTYPGGERPALAGIDLAIGDNELFTLLGPSGCGKTTLLRAIAGFEALDRGEVALFGEAIDDLPPNRRPVNTVFQHYALFPHMTVAENVAYGLLRLRRPKDEVSATVARMLRLVKLEGFAGRKPAQLSGGQQQRVALARALAPRPRVLLLDEPLSALDLQLRQAMRLELKQLQEETGITFLFVTHDQDEALAMSDRVAVLDAGRVQQVGTPAAIYERPANRFVATFIGETNVLPAQVIARTARALVLEGPGGLALEADEAPVAGEVAVSVRPERIVVLPATAPQGTDAVVRRLVFRGGDTVVHVELAGVSVVARVPSAQTGSGLTPGGRCRIAVQQGAARLLPEAAA